MVRAGRAGRYHARDVVSACACEVFSNEVVCIVFGLRYFEPANF